MVKRNIAAGCLLVWALNGLAGPLTEVEITPDPVRNGSQVFTLRMTPGETGLYDMLVFDCTYRQEYVPETSDQISRKKIRESEVFTVRRRDVKLVEELDLNVSFKVPMDLARLVEIYGNTVFDPKAPVTVSRIRISAMKAGVVVWWYEFPAGGLHKPTETGASQSRGKESRE